MKYCIHERAKESRKEKQACLEASREIRAAMLSFRTWRSKIDR